MSFNDNGQISSDLGGFEFSVSADGIPMYKVAGADTALPFKQRPQKIGELAYDYKNGYKKLTLDVKPLVANYHDLTIEDFFFRPTLHTVFYDYNSLNPGNGYTSQTSISFRYDANTGILSGGNTLTSGPMGVAAGIRLDVYC